jgi:hypothetical protein
MANSTRRPSLCDNLTLHDHLAPRGEATMAGYSDTPLVKKLGIAEGFKILAIDAPPGYRALISPLPASVSFAAKADASTNFVHAFAMRRVVLERLRGKPP